MPLSLAWHGVRNPVALAFTMGQEAKKADKNKLLADQIKMMKDQMGQMDRTVQQTRSYRR